MTDEPVDEQSMPVVIEAPEITLGRAKQINRVTIVLIAMGIVQLLSIAAMGYLRAGQQQLATTSTSLATAVDEVKVQVADLKAATLINRETGFKNRAINCQTLLAAGGSNPSCNEPDVLRYYDPNVPIIAATSADAIKNRRLTCIGLAKQGVDPLPLDCINLPGE